MSKSSAHTTVSHLAPGSSAGVLFQLERALFWLAESESSDSLVGVEAAGDVFVLNTDGASIHEEDKHSIQSHGHPFGDYDKRLWRTLEIWCDATVNGKPYERTARLLLVTNRPVSDGLVWDIHNAKEGVSLNACAERLRLISKDSPTGVAPTVESVLKYGDDVLKDVLRRIELLDANAAAAAGELRAKVVGRLHLPSSIDGDLVVQALGGWLQDSLLEKWRSNSAGWIARAALDERLHGILRELHMKRVLARSARLIPVDADEMGPVRGRRFTEHLAQIAVEDDVLEEAIEDWLRFKKESLRLLDEGDIVPGHWDDRAFQLQDRWRRIARSERRNGSDRTKEEVGYSILDRTLDPNYCAPLAGHDQPEAYLTRGQYHRLADDDAVWWFPCDKPEY